MKHTDAHRAYLQGLKQEGLMIASGPMVPRSGGALLLRLPDDEAQATLDRFATTIPTFASAWRSMSCCRGPLGSAPKTSTDSNPPGS